MTTRVRVTARCEDDLESIPGHVAEDLLDKFSERQWNPESGEPIRSLVEHTCYSLHSGRYRAATWYDRTGDVLWLLAAGIHREGSLEDFYEVAKGLEARGRLYPTDEDNADLERDRELDQRRREAIELRALRDRALQSPGSQRLSYASDAGLYAEVWAETIPNLQVVALRIRVLRTSGRHLSEPEMAVLLYGHGALSGDAIEKVDPDGDWRFRYFEDYVESPAPPDSGGR